MKLWKNLSNRLDAVADVMAAKPSKPEKGKKGKHDTNGGEA